jgi:hypothetical protein
VTPPSPSSSANAAAHRAAYEGSRVRSRFTSSTSSPFASRIPRFIPPAKPVFLSKRTRRTPGNFSAITSGDPSWEALSTQMISATGGSWASRDARAPRTNDPPLKLRTTADSTGDNRKGRAAN